MNAPSLKAALLFLPSYFVKNNFFKKFPARCFAVLALFLVVCAAPFAASAQTTFENPPFSIGNINQNGWYNNGTAGTGCGFLYDHVIHSNSGAPASFGAQSLRISNSVTSGCFDGTFSASLPNEAGESTAVNNGQSGGVRQNHFEFQFSIASAVPSAQQPGLSMSVAPDRGDGARMSYLRFEDTAAGINVVFDEYIDASPFGNAVGDAAGCGVEDDFTDVVIGTLDRTQAHTIKFVIDFVDGPRNDVVKIYINGVLATTGNSWEDYFRYCEGNQTRTVDSLGFFTRGTAVPATAGNGFLIDAVTSSSSNIITVDDNATECPTALFNNIQAAINAANPGDTVNVCSGTYNEDVSVNKAGLSLLGSNSANTTIRGPLGGDSAAVRISASNVTVANFTITRDGNNPSQWNDPNLNSAGIAIQGLAITNALIRDNNVTGNRSGIDINNSNGHTVRNNIIDNNHTGMIFRNQTDNLTVVENFITNNRTVGVIFLDASGGTNSPVQTALNSKFNNNSISGNWYGEIVDRQTGGSIPAPNTTNLKNFRSNWLGTTSPVVTTTNSAEPSYGTSSIPVIFGGTATAPSGQPDIAGPASANIKYMPLLSSGTDTNVETTPGRGTFGFQGAASTITVNPSTLNGWSAVSQRTATGTFVVGPGTPVLNFGSYRMTTGAGNSGPDLPQGGAGTGGKTWITTQQYDGTLLADITQLGYSTFVTASPASVGNVITPSLQLQVDLDGNGTRDSAMIFEPYYSSIANGGTQPNVALGQWQTWNSRAGRWWFNQPTTFGCAGCVYPTYDAIIAAYPNARIVTWYALTDGYGTQFQAGQNSAGAPWTNFDGNIDAFNIAVNSPATTFDFEPGRPSVTVNQAAGQADPTSSSPINFTVTFSEPVTGFDAADVVIGGTAGPTTKVVTGSGPTYNVAVGGFSGSGTVTASVVDVAATANSNGAPSTASTSTDNTVTFFTCNTISIPTGQTVGTNTQFVSPLNIDDTTGRNILGYSFVLSYNPAVITPIAVENAGTLSAGWTVTTNNSPGTLNVVVFNPPSGPLTGSGVLINVRFVSIGGIGTTSSLGLSSVLLNEGIPCVTTVDGNVSVVSGAVSGTVSYANAPSFRPVPNTTMTASPAIPMGSQITNASGFYSLSGFGAGNYTVTPSKNNQVNGISNQDATSVAQHIVGFITLNATQLLAADVTQNGTVTSLDATYIAQQAALTPNPSFAGTWRFIPANRSYSNIQTNQTSQDYSAILLGEVTGNWNQNGALRQATPVKSSNLEKNTQLAEGSPDQVVTVSAPNPYVTAPTGNFTIGLTASNTTGEGIFGYEFNLLYDSSILTTQAVPCDTSGTISVGRSVVCNPLSPGLLRVVVFSTTGVPISGAGTLLKLNFTANGTSGQTSPLTLQNFMFNEGVPDDITVNGQVILAVATAANGSISGTIADASGNRIPGALVILTNAAGESVTTLANSKGKFIFRDVPVGEVYTLNISAKRYTFSPQVVSMTNNLHEVIFTAEP